MAQENELLPWATTNGWLFLTVPGWGVMHQALRLRVYTGMRFLTYVTRKNVKSLYGKEIWRILKKIIWSQRTTKGVMEPWRDNRMASVWIIFCGKNVYRNRQLRVDERLGRCAVEITKSPSNCNSRHFILGNHNHIKIGKQEWRWIWSTLHIGWIWCLCCPHGPHNYMPHKHPQLPCPASNIQTENVMHRQQLHKHSISLNVSVIDVILISKESSYIAKREILVRQAIANTVTIT